MYPVREVNMCPLREEPVCPVWEVSITVPLRRGNMSPLRKRHIIMALKEGANITICTVAH